MDRFTYCLGILFGNEGGTSNNPADHGGLTQMGVTQATYSAYRARMGLVTQSVTLGTIAEFSSIYQTEYWATAHCDVLPAPVDLCVFDTAVNSGPGRAVMLLQAALGVTADGEYGPATAVAVQALNPTALAGQYCDQRELFVRQFVARDPSQAVFLNGWLNRVNKIRGLAGVTDN